jgi:3-dehydroquinate synthase
MKGIFVGTKPSYKVIIGSRALTQVGSLIEKTAPDVQKVLIVSDTNVAPLFLETVKKSIGIKKIEVCEYIFEAGERSKNIDSIAGMWGVMAENKFTRNITL